jgi:uncharacterized cupin superfamily protein
LRTWQKLGDAAGLTQFGVNLVRLPPGAWSSQRHWHSHEDEFVYVLEGELVMVTSAGGEETRVAGSSAGFKAGVADGHHFQNRSAADAVFLAVGSRPSRRRRGVPGHRLGGPTRPPHWKGPVPPKRRNFLLILEVGKRAQVPSLG